MGLVFTLVDHILADLINQNIHNGQTQFFESFPSGVRIEIDRTYAQNQRNRVSGPDFADKIWISRSETRFGA
ncbi:MAG: hypothetical protein ACRC2M_25970 [Planktothrix sp.]